MPLLAAVKKALGARLKIRGLASVKKNAYFNIMYGFPGWVLPIRFSQYVTLYQRSKIGINVHNRGDYTVGGYRLFDLPANGVLQLSDGGNFVNQFFFREGEIVLYKNANDLIEKVKYYLSHDEERNQIALHGFRRVRKDYRISDLLRKAGECIANGMISVESKV
jgi:spore maturation protein CgeB